MTARYRRVLVPFVLILFTWLLFHLPISKQLLTLLHFSTYDLIFDIYNAFSDRDSGAVIEDIVIVDIDEESISKLGQYSSWPNLYFADLVDSLANDSPMLIGFDVFFSESDKINEFGQERLHNHFLEHGYEPYGLFEQLSFDEDFAQAIKEAGNVYLSMFNSSIAIDSIYLPPTLSAWQVPGAKALPVSNPKAPLPILAEAAKGVGFAIIEPDLSGIIHDYPLFFQYADSLYVNFSLQACLDLLQVDDIRMDKDLKLFSKRKEVRNLPLNNNKSFYLNFYGKSRRFRYVSFSDVLLGRIPQRFFTDKIVLVGSSASGLRDNKTTPLDTYYPGVELHATMMMNVLADDFVHFIPLTWNWALAVLLVLILVVCFRFMKPYYTLFIFLAGSFCLLVVFLSFFARMRLCFDYSVLISVWVLAYLGLLINESQMHFAEKKKVRNAFEHYVSKSVITQIMKMDNLLQVGGSRKKASILFCDIRNFSGICEQLPAEEISDFLNTHFNNCTKILTRHGGTLDKYIGDALLGLFNVPIEHPFYQLDACDAAWGIMLAAQELQKEYATHEILSSFRIGIGIASGEIIAGNFGSEEIFNYTGIGDKMNLASRLESLNKVYLSSIIIDSATYEAVKDRYLCRWLDRVCVKGKGEALDIYEIMSPMAEANEQQKRFCAFYHEGLAAMINSQEDKAKAAFTRCLEIKPTDPPTQLMLSRLKELNWDNWDGIWRYQSK